MIRLTFPFRNKTYHDIVGFYSNKSIRDYILIQQDKYPYTENYFDKDIEFYRSSLINFESELLQVINTTTQETIDIYFNELYDYANDVYKTIDIDNLRQIVLSINEKELSRYNEKIESETLEYFNDEKRKLPHLASYEAKEYFGLSGLHNLSIKIINRINYNYYCVEGVPDIIDEKYIEEYYKFVRELAEEFFILIRKYIQQWKDGKIKSRQFSVNKPVLFVEGELDICYIKRAAEILNQETLINSIEIRQRGGSQNLNKLWHIFKDENWETIPQKKMLLYDCDTKTPDEDYGFIFKRATPFIENNPIKKGIENLFPFSTIQKAIDFNSCFVDLADIKGLTRGEKYESITYEINKDEKRNFCDWICSSGGLEDFVQFQKILELLALLLENNQ